MDTPTGDFSLPGPIVMGTGGRERLGRLIEKDGTAGVGIITDPASSESGIVAALKKIINTRGMDSLFTLKAPPLPLTPEDLAKSAGQAGHHGAGLTIVTGGTTAMAFSAHFSTSATLAEPAATILIPTTPMAAFSAVLPLAMGWDPIQEEMKLASVGAHYPSAVILDTQWGLKTARGHSTDPGLAPLSLAMEALLHGNGDPFGVALASEGIRRLRPSVLQAAGGTEDPACWENLLIGGLMVGMAYPRCGATRGFALTQALAHLYHLDPTPVMGMLGPEIMRDGVDLETERISFLATLVGSCWPSPVATGKQFVDYALGGSRQPLPSPLDAIGNWVKETVRETAPGELEGLGRLARQKARQTLDRFQFIDHWSARQTLQALATDIQTLNRQVAFLMDRPLNLKKAGVEDNLARLSRVVSVTGDIHGRMGSREALDDRKLEDWVYAAYRTRQGPLEVDPDFL
jgi:alcohol dehydrogenase class IV